MNGTKQTNIKKGPKIDQATIDKILTIAKKSVKSDIINSDTPKRSALKDLGKTALNVAKDIAPELVGLIPGVGPIAKMVLSTLNDDEWFEEYSSAGATFSELLAIDNRNRQTYSADALGIGAIYQINTIVDLSAEIFDDVYSMVIANIRSKTDNVLVSDPDAYRQALDSASKLVAIYFTLRKYLNLAEKPPINIPGITDEIAIISPKYISQMKGVADTLEAWLKSTTALPHAWFSYLRWRFGSVFYSDNTGKPGLVLYDYTDCSYDEEFEIEYEPFTQMYLNGPYYCPETVNMADRAINKIINLIQSYKQMYIGTSRAGADIKLAYKDHVNDFTVEKPHYDEKEYNLRVNQWAPVFTGDDMKDERVLYMDSRLSSSPAIQAVTISTGQFTPLKVSSRVVHFYLQQSMRFEAGVKVNNHYVKDIVYPAGWHGAYVDGALHFDGALLSSYSTVNPDPDNVPTLSAFINSFSFYGCESHFSDKSLEYISDSITSPQDVGTIITKVYDKFYGKLVLDSLQGHSNNVQYGLYTQAVFQDSDLLYDMRMCNLAYDRATITDTQLYAIQRTALRNLWRPDYKMKAPVSKNEELSSSIKELKEVVVENSSPTKA